jgi:hypothetical protein
VQGVLHTECERIFRRDKSRSSLGLPLQLHRHQDEAVRAAQSGESYLLTTGTGSGKSLAYFIPIVDHVLKHGGSGRGIKAIVVYPMNALANGQAEELRKFLTYGYPPSGGPVTFARYTGQESADRLAPQTVHERARTPSRSVPLMPTLRAAPSPAAPDPASPVMDPPAPQPSLPGFSASASDLRQKTLKLAVERLRRSGALTSRELAQQLSKVDRRIDRHLVNSVLSREGATAVVHHPATGKFTLRAR